MGNKAKRKEVAKLLREQGLGPLYKGNKKVAWRMLRASRLNTSIYKLGYKPGDIVNDCDCFNHILTKWIAEKHKFLFWLGVNKLGWVKNVEQFEKEKNHFSCGCPYGPEPARSREDIENYYLRYVNDPKLIEGGWINEYNLKIKDALESGKHICDEKGIILPEYRRIYNKPQGT